MTTANLTDFLSKALDEAESGAFVQALEALQQASQMERNSSFIYHVMGLVAVRMGEVPKAIDLFKQAHQMAPEMMEHAEALSILHARTGNVSDSLYYGKLSTVLKASPLKSLLLPEWLGSFEGSFTEVEKAPFLERGTKALRRGLLRRALTEFQREAELHPNHGEPWRLLAQVLRLQRRPVEEALILQGLEDSGDLVAYDYAEIGHVLNALGRRQEAKAAYQSAKEREPDNPDIYAQEIADLYHCEDPVTDEILDAETAWGQAFAADNREGSAGETTANVQGTLTVGFVSSRFRLDAGLDHLLPLFLHPHRGRLKINLYCYNAFDDAMTRRVAGSVNEFQDLRNVDEKTAATIIRNDGVQVLIDLDGVATPHHTRLYGEGACPIQLRYNGLAASAEAMGYTAAFGSEFSYSGEQNDACLVKGGFFGLPSASQSEQETLSSAGGLKVLGWMPCFNKVNDHSLEMLKKITQKFGDISVRVFSNSVGGPQGVNELLGLISRHGLQPLVEFSDWSADMEEARSSFFSGVDLMLDIGGDAGTDNLLSSVMYELPTVSIPGRLPEAREGSSILQAIVGDGWICRDVDDLVAKLERWKNTPGLWKKDRSTFQEDVRLSRAPQYLSDRFSALEEALFQLVGRS
ncbi:tetratricopeptide repeat protein [Aestuariispira ectoiniformans]|uniref:tetratricopeptide repeat protein n=1 Tax=Aestuariispira ectoiniformans TaxID=2775080 RepID=UPI00223C1AAD|nr:tetratricopeptide repeat protein [Aestuariispira ectoiniformans]